MSLVHLLNLFMRGRLYKKIVQHLHAVIEYDSSSSSSLAALGNFHLSNSNSSGSLAEKLVKTGVRPRLIKRGLTPVYSGLFLTVFSVWVTKCRGDISPDQHHQPGQINPD